METLNALILGIVQGLAEYLPISSSGHLVIFSKILGLDLSGAESLEFDIMLHVATVLSTIVVLWREFYPLCVSFFTVKRDPQFFYVLKILLSCIPVGIVGVCLKDYVEEFFNPENPDILTYVGIFLLITAALLAFTWFFRTKPEQKHGAIAKGRNITYFDAFIIGCAQAVAVLPGLSRSGSTIATGILIGDKREEVARFSFFMVIIPILGESLLDLVKAVFGSNAEIAAADTAASSLGWLPMLVGFLAAFIVGCLACKWMLNIVKKGKLVWFAVYCLAIGLICIIF